MVLDRHPRLRAFLFPRWTPLYAIRVAAVALFSLLFFTFVLRPFVVRGASMEPTYRDGSFHFLLRPRYLLSEPRRGDVVALRLAGERVVLLKRVVAFPGEEVAFRGGVLLVDGVPLEEPYVQGPCDWELPPRRVEAGNLYVVGDNRSMPMEQHDFGQVSRSRILGAPLW
ncbi:MAG: signal peptidase I [Acidobacteriota bacterium]